MEAIDVAVDMLSGDAMLVCLQIHSTLQPLLESLHPFLHTILDSQSVSLLESGFMVTSPGATSQSFHRYIAFSIDWLGVNVSFVSNLGTHLSPWPLVVVCFSCIFHPTHNLWLQRPSHFPLQWSHCGHPGELCAQVSCRCHKQKHQDDIIAMVLTDHVISGVVSFLLPLQGVMCHSHHSLNVGSSCWQQEGSRLFRPRTR